MASKTYEIVGRSSPQSLLTAGQLDALDFLKNTGEPSSTVASTLASFPLIEDFTRLNPDYYYGDFLMQTSCMSCLASFLTYNSFVEYGDSPYRYVLLDGENSQYSSLPDWAASFSSVLYSSSSATILSVPHFAPPSDSAATSIVVSNEDTKLIQEVLGIVSTLGLDYTTESSNVLPSQRNVVLVGDINTDSAIENTIVQRLESSSQQVIVLETDLSGGLISNYLGIDSLPNVTLSNTLVLANKSVDTAGDIKVPIFEASNTTTRILGYSTESGAMGSPLVFAGELGNTSVTVLELAALLGGDLANSSLSLPSYAREYLSILFEGLPQTDSAQAHSGVILTEGDLTAVGNVSISASSMYIPGADPKASSTIIWDDTNLSSGWSFSTLNATFSTAVETPSNNGVTVVLNASASNVWQYVSLAVPNVSAKYLYIDESIQVGNYTFGFLRLTTDTGTYVLRGWTPETVNGHSEEQLVFDLTGFNFGVIKSIYWTGHSDAAGGSAVMRLNAIALVNDPAGAALLSNPLEITMDASSSDVRFLSGNETSSVGGLLEGRLLSYEVLGDVNVSLLGSSFSLEPPGIDEYVGVSFTNDTLLRLDLGGGSALLVEIDTSGGNEVSAVITNGTVSFKLSSLANQVYLKAPFVEARGSLVLNDSFLTWPYTIYSPWKTVTIEGNVSIRLLGADQTYVLSTDMKFSGRYQVAYNATPYNDYLVPWETALLNPLFLMAVMVVAYLVIARRKS